MTTPFNVGHHHHKKPRSPSPRSHNSPRSSASPASRRSPSTSAPVSRMDPYQEPAGHVGPLAVATPSTSATPAGGFLSSPPIREGTYSKTRRPSVLEALDQRMSIIRVATFVIGSTLTVLIFGLLTFYTLWVPTKQQGKYNGDILAEACGVVEPSQLTVVTSSGKAYGQLATIVDAIDNATRRGVLRQFFGIPYAKAPTGENRFRMAEASSYFLPDGNWNAKDHGPPCPQTGRHYEDSAEDCLKLSIWAPFVCNSSGPMKPVAVAISGEWLQTGDIRDHEDFWQDLALRGDMVVVAVNHRVGVMGFFNGEANDAPGNVGIYDVYLALTWIQNNARVFHGDRDLMVALGHGSGAFILSLDLLSQNVTGDRFFRRFVLHDLSVNTMFPRNDDTTGVALLQKLVVCPPSPHPTVGLTRCLRSMNYSDIVDKVNGSMPLRFVPSRYRPPLALINQSDLAEHLRPLRGVEIITGYNALEGGALFDDYLVPGLKLNASVPTADAYALFAHFYTDRTQHSYNSLPWRTKIFLEQPNFQGFREFLTEFSLACPSSGLATATSAQGATVYHYASVGPQKFFEPVISIDDIIGFAKTG